MSLKNFNDQSEKPKFIYKPNQLVPHSWQIFGFSVDTGELELAGEYILIDKTEDPEITEKKLVNIIALMNSGKPLVDFKNLTTKRVLFNMVPDTPESTRHKLVFRTYDGKGVSKENAVLTIEKGVFHDPPP